MSGAANSAAADADVTQEVTQEVTCVELGDGRVVAYEVHGDPTGVPVVLFHGSPGSRLFVPPIVPTGIRLVTFDRPGYGCSTTNPGRTVLDAASDVVALCDLLEIDRVALIGWSGGCPFAVATAFSLGANRVSGLGIVSGPGPLDEVPGAWDALGERRRPAAVVARNGEAHRATRGIARTMAPFVANPIAFLSDGRGPDRDLLADATLRPMLEAQIVESLCSGADGIAQDLIAMWMPFGFALRDVDVPTQIFHGALDRDNGADVATYAGQIPNASLTLWPDRAHFAILACFDEVVTKVLT